MLNFCISSFLFFMALLFAVLAILESFWGEINVVLSMIACWSICAIGAAYFMRNSIVYEKYESNGKRKTFNESDSTRTYWKRH